MLLMWLLGKNRHTVAGLKIRGAIWPQFCSVVKAAATGEAEAKDTGIVWTVPTTPGGRAVRKTASTTGAAAGAARKCKGKGKMTQPKSATVGGGFAALAVDEPPTAAAAAPAEPTLAELAAEQLPEQEHVVMAKQSTKQGRRNAGRAQREKAKATAAAAAKPQRKRKSKMCRDGDACTRPDCWFRHSPNRCLVVPAAPAEAAEAPPPADEPKGPTAEEMRLAQEVFTQQEELATKDEELAAMKAQMEEMKRQLAQQTKAGEPPKSRSFAPAWMS